MMTVERIHRAVQTPMDYFITGLIQLTGKCRWYCPLQRNVASYTILMCHLLAMGNTT